MSAVSGIAIASPKPVVSTLADLLAARGFSATGMVAIRNTLHTDDVSNDFRTLADVIEANALPMLDRMQDGPRIAHDTLVLSFAALDNARARLTGFRRFLMRRRASCRRTSFTTMTPHTFCTPSSPARRRRCSMMRSMKMGWTT
jgi:hypothetical protein